MKRTEALQILGMILDRWPGKETWDAERISAYAEAIEGWDAELTTNAVLRAAASGGDRPTITQLREFVSVESALAAAEKPAPVPPGRSGEGPPEGRIMPLWVKRWVCARFLFARLGKEVDMRSFREQQPHVDSSKEFMPDDAWVKEAEKISDKQAWAAINAGVSSLGKGEA